MHTIDDKYELINVIGEGSFGKIYNAVNKLTNETVAIKIEKTNLKSLLHYEASMYKILKDIKGIPSIKGFGSREYYNFLVMEKLGHSLDKLKKICGGKFELKTILFIAIQIINRIEQIHKLGILHRDIKPDNFLIGIGKHRNLIYIIDFGLSKYYVDSDWNHIKKTMDKDLTGTIKYMSENVHNNIEPSRRDDMISIGYVLISFFKKLPWSNIKNIDNLEDKHKKILEIKTHTSNYDLCLGMPLEFCIYMEYCKKLEYDETPNYAYLKSLFANLFKMKKFKSNDELEWTYK